MSNMVQCPKCRAILQEPPPGNPYYKCGSCFTVLQAKHAKVMPGQQRPMGEEIRRPATRTVMRSLNDEKPATEPPAESDSMFRRQRTLPSRLRNSVVDDEGQRDEGDEEGAGADSSNSQKVIQRRSIPAEDPDDSEAIGAGYRRQRTLPSRLPAGDGQEDKNAAQSADDSKAGGTIKGSSKQKVKPVFSRQRTLPSKIVDQSEGKEEGRVQNPGVSTEGEDGVQEKGEGEASGFRRTRTLPSKVGGSTPPHAHTPAPAPPQGILKKSESSRNMGLSRKNTLRNDETVPDGSDDVDMFRRQKTLPSLLQASPDVDDYEDEDEEAVNQVDSGGFVRQKTLPSRLQSDGNFDDDVDNNEDDEEYDEDVDPESRARRAPRKSLDSLVDPNTGLQVRSQGGSQVPARLQALLDKKGNGGQMPVRIQSESASRFTGKSKGADGPDARQALREALLSGARNQAVGGPKAGGKPVHGRVPSDPFQETGRSPMDLRRVVSVDHHARLQQQQQQQLEASRKEHMPRPAPVDQPVGSNNDGKNANELPMLPPPESSQVVECQSCGQMLAVPPNLPPNRRGIQKLRCGKCLRVSMFALRPPQESAPEPPAVSRAATLSRLPEPAPPAEKSLPRRVMSNSELDASAAMAGASRQQQQQVQVQGRTGGGPAPGQRRLSSGLGGLGSRRVDEYQRRVTVNGQPVTDRMVIKAEEKAGPIYPGNYWYDYNAGFWGVMGGPCLGIIPPFIAELNFPIPHDCAGGQTRVYVNGRELHRRDLDLLKKRGLPEMPNRLYSVDIYGKVVDEKSGVEMRLGRLAPSLEEKKRGGGMFAHNSK